MNLKKYLQEQAAKETETLLTEADKLFIKKLVWGDEESESQEIVPDKNSDDKHE